jgi:thymidylate synthase
MLELIIDDSMDWTPLSKVPSYKTILAETFWRDAPSTNVVYLVAHKDDLETIGDEILHEQMGYIGQTSNCQYRVASLKSTAHNCGKYIRSQGWSKDDVFIRCLYTADGDQTTLEKHLHDEMKSQFGYRFKWRSASAGNDGKVVQIDSLLEKCNKAELKEVLSLTKNRLSDILLQEFMEEED